MTVGRNSFTPLTERRNDSFFERHNIAQIAACGRHDAHTSHVLTLSFRPARCDRQSNFECSEMLRSEIKCVCFSNRNALSKDMIAPLVPSIKDCSQNYRYISNFQIQELELSISSVLHHQTDSRGLETSSILQFHFVKSNLPKQKELPPTIFRQHVKVSVFCFSCIFEFV